MKQFSLFRTGAIAALALGIVLAPASRADDWDKKTIITVNNPLEVPGATLQPGKYVMKLFNSSSNRHIVQIMNEREDKLLALTFTVAAQRPDPSDKTILNLYEGSNGQPEALHMWFYPGESRGQEFLYPHDQAVRISQRTNQKVPEATAEESAAIMSKDSSTVELKTDADRRSVQESSAQEPVVVAQAEPAPAPRPAPMIAQARETPAQAPSLATENAAPQPTPSSIPSSLPQTAGEGPLAALIGGLSLAAAFTLLTMRRRRVQ